MNHSSHPFPSSTSQSTPTLSPHTTPRLLSHLPLSFLATFLTPCLLLSPSYPLTPLHIPNLLHTPVCTPLHPTYTHPNLYLSLPLPPHTLPHFQSTLPKTLHSKPTLQHLLTTPPYPSPSISIILPHHQPTFLPTIYEPNLHLLSTHTHSPSLHNPAPIL